MVGGYAGKVLPLKNIDSILGRTFYPGKTNDLDASILKLNEVSQGQ